MSLVAVQVEDLAKEYRVGALQDRFTTLRDRIGTLAREGWRRLLFRSSGRAPERVRALDGVSFEIRQGEIVGIIGRNGAGKTTLLKVLSRITEPTSGRAVLLGRVGSLLEVGTGFHPELTGRENVFLNGAILGMRRRDIELQFDAIVDFSGVSKFIDTPVKRYSSGMQVRLAFAVAAHLDPDILLIDEVLAVGDAGFQKKCLRSIRDATSSARTAIVVSHNMAVVRSLCTRVLWLDGGRLVQEGPPEEVVQAYLASYAAPEGQWVAAAAPQGSDAWVSKATLRRPDGGVVSDLHSGEGFVVDFEIQLREGMTIGRPWLAVYLYSAGGELLALMANREAGYELPTVDGVTTISCEVREPNLLPGEYTVGFLVSDVTFRVYDRLDSALSFSVAPSDVYNSGMPLPAAHGNVYFETRWSAVAGTAASLAEEEAVL